MARIHDIESPRNLAVQPLNAATFAATGRTLDTDTGPPRRVWARVWPREKLIDQIPDKPVADETGLPLDGLASTQVACDGKWRIDSIPGAMPSRDGHLNTLAVWADFRGSQFLTEVVYFHGQEAGDVVSEVRMLAASGSTMLAREDERAILASEFSGAAGGAGETAAERGFQMNLAKPPAELPLPPTPGTSGTAGEPVALAISGSAGSSASEMLGIDQRAPAKVRRGGFYVAASSTSGNGRRRRLLWVGDAVAHTGFATVTHSILEHLQDRWDVQVLGINYDGQPHDYPYPIHTAREGGDMWGIGCFHEVCDRLRPDVVLINNDWWNVTRFLKLDAQVPIVGYMPVDGKNLDPQAMETLSGLSMAIWYTQFGRQEAEAAGYTGPSAVVAHGVDVDAFHGVARHEARRRLLMPVAKGDFVVSNVNRNQPRKRLDLTIQYFADWVHGRGVADAYLYLHCSENDVGWNVRQLAAYFGVGDRLLLPQMDDAFRGFPRRLMPYVYCAADVQVSTSLGEGWGLTTMEGMACGVPQIVPSWAALGEWPRHVAAVPCRDTFVHPQYNTIGGVPDKTAFVASLDELYDDGKRRRHSGKLGHRHVQQRPFRWPHIAHQFDEILSTVVA